MTVLSQQQIAQYWLKDSQGTKYHSRAWATLMSAIGEAESSGNLAASNPTDNNGQQTSWGLFEISNGTHSEVSPNWQSPDEQVKLAIGKLQSQGITAWGTYDSGAYKSFLPGGSSFNLPPNVSGSGSGSGSSSGSKGSGFVWYEPWTWASGAASIGTDIERVALMGVGVLAGVGLVVLGVARATGHKADPVTIVENTAKKATEGAALAAAA